MPDADVINSSRRHRSDRIDRLWERTRPTPVEMASGLLGLVSWLIFFAGGVVIPTTSIRNALVATVERHATTAPAAAPATAVAAAPTTQPRDDLSGPEIVGYFFATVSFFTVTNLFVIGTTSSFLGCMARRWSTPFDRSMVHEMRKLQAAARVAPREPESEDEQKRRLADAKLNDAEAIREVRRAYTTAVLRGFLAYALVVGGYLVVIPENSLSSITPGQYIRLAGLVTAISFLVGFEPNSLGRLLKLVFNPEDAERDRRNGEQTQRENATVRENLAAQGDPQPDPPDPSQSAKNESTAAGAAG